MKLSHGAQNDWKSSRGGINFLTVLGIEFDQGKTAEIIAAAGLGPDRSIDETFNAFNKLLRTIFETHPTSKRLGLHVRLVDVDEVDMWKMRKAEQ